MILHEKISEQLPKWRERIRRKSLNSCPNGVSAFARSRRNMPILWWIR
jgi:hypothetical protein